MMQTSPIVTVIMPAYNTEHYLDESIQSILNQTYTNFEFIIIDDGSSDGSLKVIKKYQKIDSRIIVISRENKGKEYSLNEALLLAKGKYFALMDSDDISLPSRLKKQIEFLELNPAIIACGSWIKVFNSKKNFKKIQKFPLNKESCWARMLFGMPMPNPPSIINIRALLKLFDSDGFIFNHDMKYIEDYDLWVRLSMFGSYANIQEVLLEYRDTPGSATDIGESKIKDRFKKTSQITDKFLNRLGIFLSDKQKKIHFDLALNSRIKVSSNSQLQFLKYINELIDLIISSSVTSKKEKRALVRLLYKKILVVIFLRRQNPLDYLFNKRYYLALYCLLIGQIWKI